MKRAFCRDCGKELGNMEIALNLKLRGKGVGSFFCVRCLAERTDSTDGELLEMARYFAENGCELFSARYVNEE